MNKKYLYTIISTRIAEAGITSVISPTDSLGCGSPTGMIVEFENGMHLSIQYHWGSYSSVGRNTGGDVTVETAVTLPGGKFWDPATKAPWVSYQGHFDQVQGWQTIDDVVALARLVAQQPAATEPE
jgi:hypothetical protein